MLPFLRILLLESVLLRPATHKNRSDSFMALDFATQGFEDQSSDFEEDQGQDFGFHGQDQEGFPITPGVQIQETCFKTGSAILGMPRGAESLLF